jgi:hypothetical protein
MKIEVGTVRRKLALATNWQRRDQQNILRPPQITMLGKNMK